MKAKSCYRSLTKSGKNLLILKGMLLQKTRQGMSSTYYEGLWSPGVGIWLTMETQGWGNGHLKTWKCQISRGLPPPPPILGQTIDRGITLSWAGFRQIIRFFINLAWYKILILVQSSVFIDRLRVMLRYMHSYLTLLMTKYTATDSNNLKCHALLAALYFPLESTSHSVLLLTHFFHHGNLHSSQCQIFRFCIIISRT